MYNHYIPQSDGSFRRSSVPEPSRRPQRPPAAPPVPPSPPPPESAAAPEPIPCPLPEPAHRVESCSTVSESPLSFLRKLLPKDLDISDLIIIGLLLLLSSDDCDNDLSPMLTIALYFLL